VVVLFHIFKYVIFNTDVNLDNRNAIFVSFVMIVNRGFK